MQIGTRITSEKHSWVFCDMSPER